MEIIQVTAEDLYRLVKEIVNRIKAEQHITEKRWLTGTEALKKLGYKSKTSLQRLRDEGKIRYSQERKFVLYDSQSIDQYLEKNSHEIF